MKMSVSLPDSDVDFLDQVASQENMPSRSAVVHQAVNALRAMLLADAYEAAWEESSTSEWDAVILDGLADETW